MQKMGAYLHALSKEYKDLATSIGVSQLVQKLTEVKMLEATVEYFVCKKCVQNDSGGHERVLISYRVSGEMEDMMNQVKDKIWDQHLGQTRRGAPPTKSERKTQQYAAQLRDGFGGNSQRAGQSWE